LQAGTDDSHVINEVGTDEIGMDRKVFNELKTELEAAPWTK